MKILTYLMTVLTLALGFLNPALADANISDTTTIKRLIAVTPKLANAVVAHNAVNGFSRVDFLTLNATDKTEWRTITVNEGGFVPAPPDTNGLKGEIWKDNYVKKQVAYPYCVFDYTVVFEDKSTEKVGFSVSGTCSPK